MLVRRYRETVLTHHTYAHRAERLREILLEHEQRLSFCLKIGAPNREVAPNWGTCTSRSRSHASCAAAGIAR